MCFALTLICSRLLMRKPLSLIRLARVFLSWKIVYSKLSQSCLEDCPWENLFWGCHRWYFEVGTGVDSLEIFRCASISWIQVVSQSVRDVFQLAHLWVFQSYFYIVQKAVELSIIDYLKICKTVSYSLTETAQLVSRGFLRKKYPWQMIAK